MSQGRGAALRQLLSKHEQSQEKPGISPPSEKQKVEEPDEKNVFKGSIDSSNSPSSQLEKTEDSKKEEPSVGLPGLGRGALLAAYKKRLAEKNSASSGRESGSTAQPTCTTVASHPPLEEKLPMPQPAQGRGALFAAFKKRLESKNAVSSASIESSTSLNLGAESVPNPEDPMGRGKLLTSMMRTRKDGGDVSPRSDSSSVISSSSGSSSSSRASVPDSKATSLISHEPPAASPNSRSPPSTPSGTGSSFTRGASSATSGVASSSLSRSNKTGADSTSFDKPYSSVSGDASSDVRRAPSPLSSVITDFSDVTLNEKPPVVMKGSYGQEFEMTCNYIKLKLEPGKGVFEYEVRFCPEVDNQKFRYNMLFQHKEVIGEVRTFDGTILFLPFKLPEKITKLNCSLPTDGSQVEMTIIFKRQKRLGETIQLYNILFRKIMNHLGFVLMGHNFFDPSSGKPIPAHRLEVWPGYITVVDEYEGGVFLCCDASHRVLRTETCLELLNDMKDVQSLDWQSAFVNNIVGKSVLTRYNNKTYRIDDVLFDQTPMNTFPLRDGSEMTYMEYYQKHYDIKITCKDQPLLISRKRTKIRGKENEILVNLVPELSYITGLTDTMRADMKVMKDVAQYTRIPPAQRLVCIKNFVKNVNSNEIARNILKSWGLVLEDAAANLSGRILPPEDIIFDNNKIEKGKLESDWSRASTCNPVLSAVDMRNWVIMYPSREENTVRSFVEMLKKCSPMFGMRIDTPTFVNLPNDKVETYVRTLQRQISPNVQLVLTILLAARMDKYSAIKKICCLENPVPSQVVLMKTIKRQDRLRSVSQKIALQMNCKLGGTLWAVKIPLKKVMVMGIDTYHDPLRRSASISSIVVSLNPQLTRWYSKTGKQEIGQELMDSVTFNFLASLKKYAEVCGFLPEIILIYRDGVGDGQFDHIKEYEMQQLMDTCQIVSPSYKPKFLFVVVQKKINTRLFLNSNRNIENPPPGSIMDHTICRRDWFDFFLVSQNVRVGTVSPTHYVVLHNSTAMTPDQIQRFSYKLTHLYYNWPGTIRVPAPCQYAHKLAQLVGECLMNDANENLQDKLFYL